MTKYKDLSKTQRKVIREIVKHWETPYSPHRTGGSFLRYHNILMLYNSRKYEEIVKLYWKSMHNYLDILPCLYTNESVDVHYEDAAFALLDNSAGELAYELNKL